ncbi:unnamed protein product [Eruca vesicaria subsp. sativa]|uniref:Uncharacterized protein n=1 Tax=Eruca vesicaria subsp. sativa TaxID=29727 RepID=A0ABC8J6T2_ERUVS|nr:unnamed protein product [Eruca vesicaria subsp. sativa]
MDDIRYECQKFGRLVNVVIPRPNPDPLLTPSGVGKTFLEYADLEVASRDRLAINGKQWGRNIVVAEYYPENMYAIGHLDG